MIHLIKKTMTAGLGLAFITKDKIEELAKEFADKGKLSERDAREFIDDLLKRSKEARQKAENEIEKVVRDTVKKMNLATGDDLKRVEKRLEQLTEAIKGRESKE